MAEATIERLKEALASRKYVTGKTHEFYLYPARFHPDVARAAIQAFSSPDDLVFDPFMGGGTSVIEALALGRRAVGVDINALAHFIVEVKTTPLSPVDEIELALWARACEELVRSEHPEERPGIVNMPRVVETFVAGALRLAHRLPRNRQKAFARCVLLRLGQLALECTTRDFVIPRRRWLARRLPLLLSEMLSGMQEFVEECGAAGTPKDRIRCGRQLHNRSIVGIEADPCVDGWMAKPKLVLTSPPYPGVHVLYHRWQYWGRKETSAPYWIADVKDGAGASYYTLGDRKPAGVEKYFRTIVDAFRSVRAVVADNATVVQLVGFGNVAAQLPRYLAAMRDAGFEECRLDSRARVAVSRSVPNRRWYTHLSGPIDASSERLLVHRPARGG